MKRKIRSFSGLTTPEVTEREIVNRKLARKAAAEGIVLMKNDGVLPLKQGQTTALYGNGASHIIKGGTGSGDVNEREVVSVLAGLLKAGVVVTNADEVAAAEKEYDTARLAYRDKILGLLEGMEAGSDMGIFHLYATNPFQVPDGVQVTESASKADTAIFIISRIAGEGADRYEKAGDYYLSDKEKEDLKKLAELNSNIIVLINAGGQIDLTEIMATASVKAILNISQGGMETGNAVADVLTGAINPSGKLTDTWSKKYSDFPSSANFSHNNGNLEKEYYTDGIYVGYRYFDSFMIPVEFPFGFGLSYTTFKIDNITVTTAKGVTVTAAVTNTGNAAGKEVVQVYAALPQEGLKKEAKRLIGFAKTPLIAPGQTRIVTMTIGSKNLASYDYEKAAWVVEKGEYGILVGNSSACTEVAGVLEVAADVEIEKVPHVLPLKEELNEIVRPDACAATFTQTWKKAAQEKGLTAMMYVPEMEIVNKIQRDDSEARAIAEQLTDEEITAMLMGEITKGQDNIRDGELVTTGIYVPGAAGETSGCLDEKYGIPGLSMADGPAGLRILRKYEVDRATNLIYGRGLMAALEGGLFAKDQTHENADTYYMYATAIPIGTLLAQTWDPALLEEVGEMVGGEMDLFKINWWLAPGMNIHRNPLCGRNFEYYSEDPLISGVMAAAITRGVQKVPGCGTTIKHFAANNQEDNRMGVSSVVSERALREIYLRGFEIAVKTSQPMCIMTSYNLINDVHSPNSWDLCNGLARNEWDFQGIIMTDWTTTTRGGASPHGCAIAGNDLIMPGHQIDVDDIMAALKSGDLPRKDAIDCVTRMISLIKTTY